MELKIYIEKIIKQLIFWKKSTTIVFNYSVEYAINGYVRNPILAIEGFYF